MPLASLPVAASAAGKVNFAGTSGSSGNGLGSNPAEGGGSGLSKKVLLPALGAAVSVASLIGLVLFLRYRKGSKTREEEDEKDMFKPSNEPGSQRMKKGPTSSMATGPHKRTAGQRGSLSPTEEEKEQRRQALDDLMRIIGGINDVNNDGVDGDTMRNEHPFVKANRLMAEQRKKAATASGVEELNTDEEDDEWVAVEEEEEIEEEDEDAYIDRFFDYEPMPEGFADARTYCLAAIEATLALLEGRKPKKAQQKDEDSEFEDEESNPDPVLQVATQIEVDLRHRLYYFAQELSFNYFRDGEEASSVCATYAGPIPHLANMPKEGLTKKVLLQGVKEYLEVCAEIDRTKPIVVDIARQEAITGGRDKGAWRHAADRDRDVEELLNDERVGSNSKLIENAKGNKKSKGGSKGAGGIMSSRRFMDTFAENDEEEDSDGVEAVGKSRLSDPTQSSAGYNKQRAKEAAIGRMLAAREERFMGRHAADHMDELLQERQRAMLEFGHKIGARGGMGGAGNFPMMASEDFEDDDEFEDDDLDEDMAYIAEPLHDVNRRAFEAALIRAVLLQISSTDDPMTASHMETLNAVASNYKEPSENDEEMEEEDDEDDYDGMMDDGFDDEFDFFDDEYRRDYGQGEGIGGGGGGDPFFGDLAQRGRMMDLMAKGRGGRGGEKEMGRPFDHDDEFDDDYNDQFEDYYNNDEDYDDEFSEMPMGGPDQFKKMMAMMMMMPSQQRDEQKADSKKENLKKNKNAATTNSKPSQSAAKKTAQQAPPPPRARGPRAHPAANAPSSSSSQLKANINMMLGEANRRDIAALLLEDDDDDDFEDYDEDGGYAYGDEDDDADREAFIKEMIKREAAEYEAMMKNKKETANKAKPTNNGDNGTEEPSARKGAGAGSEEVGKKKKTSTMAAAEIVNEDDKEIPELIPFESSKSKADEPVNEDDDEEWESDSGAEEDEEDEWVDY